MNSKPSLAPEHPAVARVRSYFAAYHHGDSHDYAAQWTYPACLHSGGRWSVVPDAVTMARNNDAYAQAQQADGAVGGEILALDCSAIGAGAALVRGRFARLRADGSRLDEVAANYVVVRLEASGEWMVAVCLTGS